MICIIINNNVIKDTNEVGYTKSVIIKLVIIKLVKIKSVILCIYIYVSIDK